MFNMNDNKYYTPTIEEIYSSPELIQEDGSILNPFKFNYGSNIFGLEISETSDIRDIIDISKLRVKYLDREDIESLGFEYEGKATSDGDKDNFKWIGKIGGGQSILFSINNYNKKVTIIFIPYLHSSRQLFKGVIKNKFELKKLLIQLGIC